MKPEDRVQSKRPRTDQRTESIRRLIEARTSFHATLLGCAFGAERPSAKTESGRDASRAIAVSIIQRLRAEIRNTRLNGSRVAEEFESTVVRYLEAALLSLKRAHTRQWTFHKIATLDHAKLERYHQFRHLAALIRAAAKDPELKAVIQDDYMLWPNIVLLRGADFERARERIDRDIRKHASLREANVGLPILHASISCKWTMRSDRAQNARSEALNLIRNRKGRLPHVAVVTGEPTPSRLSSLALGTGDVDCVYHFALPELFNAVKELGNSDSVELLRIMIDGKRLKDIADLPLDLAI